jgi:hypothetical protein
LRRLDNRGTSPNKDDVHVTWYTSNACRARFIPAPARLNS